MRSSPARGGAQQQQHAHDAKALEAYVSLLVGDRVRGVERSLEHRLRDLEGRWAAERKILTDQVEILTTENTELQSSLADLCLQAQKNKLAPPVTQHGPARTSSELVPQQSFVKMEKRIEQLERLYKVLVGEEENFELLHRRIDQVETALRVLVDEYEGGMRQVLSENGSPIKPIKGVLRATASSHTKGYNIRTEVDSILGTSGGTSSEVATATSATVTDDILGTFDNSPRTRKAAAISTSSAATTVAALHKAPPTVGESPSRGGGSKVGKIMDNYLKATLEEKGQLAADMLRLKEAYKKAANDLEALRAQAARHDQGLAQALRAVQKLEEQQKQAGSDGARGHEEHKSEPKKEATEAQQGAAKKTAELEARIGEVKGMVGAVRKRAEELEGLVRKGLQETKEAKEQVERRDSKDLEATENLARLAASLKQRMGTVEVSVKRLDGAVASSASSVEDKLDKMRQELQKGLSKEAQARVLVEKELHYLTNALSVGSVQSGLTPVASYGNRSGGGGAASTPSRPDAGLASSTKSPRSTASKTRVAPSQQYQQHGEAASIEQHTQWVAEQQSVHSPGTPVFPALPAVGPQDFRRELRRQREEDEDAKRRKEELLAMEARLAEEKRFIEVEKERAVQRELELSRRQAAEAEAEKRRLEALAKDMEQVITTLKRDEAQKEIERMQEEAQREREKNRLILKAEQEAIERARMEVDLREEVRVAELSKELARYKAEAEAREKEREMERQLEADRARLASEAAEAQRLQEREKEHIKEAVSKQLAKFNADKLESQREEARAAEARERARLDAERELDRLKQKTEEDARRSEQHIAALKSVRKEGAQQDALRVIEALKSQRSPSSPSAADPDDDGRAPVLSAEDLASDPVLAQLDHEVRVAKQDKAATKRDIKRWLAQFERDNGVSPDTRAKETVKHLYLNHHGAVARLDKAEVALADYLREAKI